MYKESRKNKSTRRIYGALTAASLIAAPFTGGASLIGTGAIALLGHYKLSNIAAEKYSKEEELVRKNKRTFYDKLVSAVCSDDDSGLESKVKEWYYFFRK